MNTDNIKILKQKIAEFEVKYDHNEWLRLERSLPKHTPFYLNSAKIIIASLVVLVLTFVGIFLSIESEKTHEKFDAIEKISNNAGITLNNYIVKQSNPEKKLEIQENNNIAGVQITKDIAPDYTKTKEQIEDDFLIDVDKVTEDNTKYNTVSEEQKDSTIIKTNHKYNLRNLKVNVEVDCNCAPVRAFFTADNLPYMYSVIWEIHDNSQLEGNNQTVFYNKAGVYNPIVKIVYNNEVVKRIQLDEINVFPLPKATISYVNNENIYFFSVIEDEEYELVKWEINNEVFYGKNVTYEFKRSNNFTAFLRVENKYNCFSETEIELSVMIDQTFYLPNAFIPTADNINSHFGPIGQNLDFEIYQLVIADNTGRKVFETHDVNIKWNGRLFNSGKELKEGVYLWEIITVDSFGNSKTKKGRVNLLRK